MKVLVTGSRNCSNKKAIKQALLDHGATSVVQGGAAGADALAKEAAKELGLPCWTVHAEWGKYGKRAGILRNQAMLDLHHPDLVLAFPMQGSIGTWDMVRRASEALIPVVVNKLS